MNAGLIESVCYGIAVAMGIAVIITNIAYPLSTINITNLLGIGVLALGIANLART